MKNLPIILKLLTILGIFGAFSLAATVYATQQMGDIAAGFVNIAKTDGEATTQVASANRAMDGMRGDIEMLMLATTVPDVQLAQSMMQDDHQTFDAGLTSASALSPAHASEFLDLKTRGDTLVDSTCTKSIQLGSGTTVDANQAGAAEFLINCGPQFLPLVKDMIAERKAMTAQVDTDGGMMQAQTATTILLTYGMILGGLALVMAGGFFGIRNWVVSPLKLVLGAMGRLSGGELNTNLEGQERKDEIGAMVRAVQVFKDVGLEKERITAQAAQAAAAAAADRAHSDVAREAATHQREFVVNSLANGLERLSGGDLMFRLTEQFLGDNEKLRTDFNAAMETLQSTMQSIVNNTQGVRAGAAEITQSSDDLSRRTEQQAASLEQTAAALDQITATVRKTSEGAHEAREVVTAAKADAERSGDVVSETVTAMSGIESSSRQISNIIGVIDEIAFQTNLLALNAGVEAARAGDAGRGFAVVATEVRALAQRSADAAKEIKVLISASGTQVETGVRLVGETGLALTRIVEQVNRLNHLVNDIASSAKEQATGLGEVNSAVNQMDQVTQQNAAMVEESTAASHALAAEAEALARLVGRFKIGEVTREVPRVVTKPRPASRPMSAPVGKFVAVAGAPALRPAKAGSDDWNEF